MFHFYEERKFQIFPKLKKNNKPQNMHLHDLFILVFSEVLVEFFEILFCIVQQKLLRYSAVLIYRLSMVLCDTRSLRFHVLRFKLIPALTFCWWVENMKMFFRVDLRLHQELLQLTFHIHLSVIWHNLKRKLT